MSNVTSEQPLSQGAKNGVHSERPPKPQSAHPDGSALDVIPPKLVELRRWVAWKWLWRPDKGDHGGWDKPPVNPETGTEIDQTDPANWMTFRQACRAARKRCDGIGIALGPEDNRLGVVGIDLDHCVGADGHINAEASELVERFASYTERTPSGTGLRILIWGDKPGPKCRTAKRPGIELYEAGRYLTVTGWHLDGTPTQICRRDEVLAALYNEMFPAEKPKAQPSANGRSNGRLSASDEELIEKARRSKHGEEFSALFDRGDTSAYGDDDSAADLALMNRLAFWFGRDAHRMESLFGRSALGQRDKWRNRPDYREMTIGKAIEGCAEVYKPGGSAGVIGETAATGIDGKGGDRPPDYILGRGNKPQSCASNTRAWIAARRDRDWARYDRFRRAVLLGGEPLTDQHVIDLTLEIEESLGVPWSQEHTRSALLHVAHQREFSSLTEYLDSVRWDGEERVEHFFPDFYGIDRTPYHAEVARVLFLSAVARAYQPGCKVDTVPVLIGRQGCGKSTGIAALCPVADWFTDDLGNDLFAGKAGEGLQAKWIIELAELARVNRSALEVAKSFISRQVDHFRPAYGRTPQDFPRTCVFVATTNDRHPLQDAENRRFLPIRVGDGDVAAIKSVRDQLWAEAVQRYRKGEPWWIISSYLAAEAREQGETARAADAWEDILASRLEGRDRTDMVEAAGMVGITPERLSRSEQTRIGNALTKIGFDRRRETTPPRAWYYLRVSVLP